MTRRFRVLNAGQKNKDKLLIGIVKERMTGKSIFLCLRTLANKGVSKSQAFLFLDFLAIIFVRE